MSSEVILRERLGMRVREVWIHWAKEQPNPKPSWLVPWEALSEPDKEVDRRIGTAIWGDCIFAHSEAIANQMVKEILGVDRKGETMKLSFEQAVRALSSGECEGIESQFSLTLYVRWPDGTILSKLQGNPVTVHEVLGEWTLLNPKPLTEEVEVVRYELYSQQKNIHHGNYGTHDAAESARMRGVVIEGYNYGGDGFEVVPLRGTYHRLIPRKVKRREVLGMKAAVLTSGMWEKAPTTATIIAEWEEI
jgi:hypothetical protein